MALIDLKRTIPKEKKEDSKDGMTGSPPAPASEERPYCLRITLEKPELDKLGLTPQSFSGMEPIEARVLLDPVTIRDVQSRTGDKWEERRNQSVEFQILAIELGQMKAREPEKPSKYAAFKRMKEADPG